MNGVLVQIRGSRKHWTVVHDDGNGTLLVQWTQGNGRRCESRTVHGSDVVARRERFADGFAWVPTTYEED